MKNYFLKLCKWALGVLGITAVDSCDDIFPPQVAEYGCPYAEYEIKGKVVNSKTGRPLKKIEVEAFQQYQAYDGEIILEPVYGGKDTTGTDGIFGISGDGMVFYEDIVLKCRDIDLSDGDHGETEVNVPLTDKNTEGAGNWYMGKFFYDASEIKMTEKPAE